MLTNQIAQVFQEFTNKTLRIPFSLFGFESPISGFESTRPKYKQK